MEKMRVGRVASTRRRRSAPVMKSRGSYSHEVRVLLIINLGRKQTVRVLAGQSSENFAGQAANSAPSRYEPMFSGER
jgi:hypothetical protein